MRIEPSRGDEVRVLIAEDEPLVAMLLADLVEDAGFAVAGSAATAEEALRIADAERPTVAIVDVNLRGARDGVEAGAHLAARGAAIIFMSGQVDLGACAGVRALAPVAVLPKPCPPARIIDALQAAARAAPAALADTK